MNKLPMAKKAQIINCLVEGMSLRATSRLADVSINTVTKLLVDTGKACQSFHDEQVHSLNCKRVQCDEIGLLFMPSKRTPQKSLIVMLKKQATFGLGQRLMQIQNLFYHTM